MKIAFTSSGTTWDSIIDPRFGRTAFILVFDEEKQELRAIGNDSVKETAHGAGTATAQRLYELMPDVLITGNGPGETASKALGHMSMKIYINASELTIRQAYENYLSGSLPEMKLNP